MSETKESLSTRTAAIRDSLFQAARRIIQNEYESRPDKMTQRFVRLTPVLLGLSRPFTGEPPEASYLGSMPFSTAELQFAAYSLARDNKPHESGPTDRKELMLYRFMHKQAMIQAQRAEGDTDFTDAEIRVQSIPDTAYGMGILARLDNVQADTDTVVSTLHQASRDGVGMLLKHAEDAPAPYISVTDMHEVFLAILNPLEVERAYLESLRNTKHPNQEPRGIISNSLANTSEPIAFARIIDHRDKNIHSTHKNASAFTAALAISYRQFATAWKVAEELNIDKRKLATAAFDIGKQIMFANFKTVQSLLSD